MRTYVSHLEGTFVAAILTLDRAHLFSDGIVILNHPSYLKKKVSDQFSKVHKINPHCAILTYGRYLPDLVTTASNRIDEADDLDTIKARFNSIFEELWDRAPKDGVKTGAIIVCFDKKRVPCSFVMESTSIPPFHPGPIHCPTASEPITIGAVCHDEGRYASCQRLIAELQKLIGRGFRPTHETFRAAFDNVKKELSLLSDEIGGNTFELILKP